MNGTRWCLLNLPVPYAQKVRAGIQRRHVRCWTPLLVLSETIMLMIRVREEAAMPQAVRAR